jgi:hypothetical protein
MARTVATVPAGSRITDLIRLGVIAKTFPMRVHGVLHATGKASIRQRYLPTHAESIWLIWLKFRGRPLLQEGSLFDGLSLGALPPFESSRARSYALA